MTIFFDCSNVTDFRGKPTGVPRIVMSLAVAFKSLDSRIEYVSMNNRSSSFHYVHGKPGDMVLGDIVSFNDNDVLFTAGATWDCSFYHQKIRDLKDIGVKFYQVFYDMTPAIFPHFYKEGNDFGIYYLNWSKAAYNLCDEAFAISLSTKNDMNILRSDNFSNNANIEVIRLGEDFYDVEDELYRPSLLERDLNFVLSVGTLEHRKNHTVLLDAYRNLIGIYGDRLPKLIIVGNQGWNDGGIRYQVEVDPCINRYIQVETEVTDSKLAWLYKHCLFTLYPSFYEGWGLPVSESLRYRKPCICSGISSMLEIAPNLTFFASPYSVEDWVASIAYLIEHPSEIDCITQKISRTYQIHKWTDTANSILSKIRG